MAFIDYTLARGLANQLLKNEHEVIRASMERITAVASKGSQRDGPKYRKIVEGIEHEFADRMLVSVDFSMVEDARAYYLLNGIASKTEPRLQVVGLLVRKKRGRRLDTFPIPLIIYRHVVERLMTRTGGRTFNEFTPELSAALRAPLMLHFYTREWPSLYAENQSYCLPSPNGAFFGELDRGWLKILTFVDNNKFTDRQLARHDFVRDKLDGILEAEGIKL